MAMDDIAVAQSLTTFDWVWLLKNKVVFKARGCESWIVEIMVPSGSETYGISPFQ
jgi:hypothetical protein